MKFLAPKYILGLIAAAHLMSSAAASHASLILGSDFSGRVVSGSVATAGFSANGVDVPASLTADFDLFDTPDSQNRIAVDRNIHNEGDWTASVALGVQENFIDLEIVSLQALIFNNGGRLQGVSNTSRDLDLTVAILDSSNVEVSPSQSVLNIYAASGPWTPTVVSFDFTGTRLDANTSYTLAITASGQGPGNNAGFDDLRVTGTIPAPSPLLLIGFRADCGCSSSRSIANPLSPWRR